MDVNKCKHYIERLYEVVKAWRDQFLKKEKEVELLLRENERLRERNYELTELNQRLSRQILK